MPSNVIKLKDKFITKKLNINDKNYFIGDFIFFKKIIVYTFLYFIVYTYV